jgi:hypothetical protein
MPSSLALTFETIMSERTNVAKARIDRLERIVRVGLDGGPDRSDPKMRKIMDCLDEAVEADVAAAHIAAKIEADRIAEKKRVSRVATADALQSLRQNHSEDVLEAARYYQSVRMSPLAHLVWSLQWDDVAIIVTGIAAYITMSDLITTMADAVSKTGIIN